MDFDNNKQVPLLENESKKNANESKKYVNESKNHEEPRMRMNNFLSISKVRHNKTGKVISVHARTRRGRNSTLLTLEKTNIPKIFHKKTRRNRRTRRVSTRRH